MDQLLRITSIPPQIKIESTPAQLKLKTERPQMNVERQINGLKVETKPAEISISTRAMRQSIYTMKSPLETMREYAQRGLAAAGEATAAYAEKGNLMADIAHGVTIADIVRNEYMAKMPETNIEFIPSERASVNYTPSEVHIEYVPDDVNIEWQVSRPEFEYVPHSVKISLERHGSVKIEYIGEPNYFPKSASVEKEKVISNPRLLERQMEEFRKNSDMDKSWRDINEQHRSEQAEGKRI